MIFFSWGFEDRIDDLIFFPTPRVDAGLRHFVDLLPVCSSAKSVDPDRLWCLQPVAEDPVFNSGGHDARARS
jgi:hypothetical protein